ncbi:MAG: DMT family transporter [Burkholderiales bacterium]|nr:DMT family transporter [Burkholderiales bacterium]MDE2626613.1 DMT family transporter [Burkholderiales bacterium]
MHRLKNWQLLAICVLTWGTTWYAITFQIGHTAPEVGVALRFGLAGAVVLAMCTLRGVPLRFAPREHALLALQGGFMYGVSYLCVYHAEQHVVSGLVAVGYSASPLVSGLGARWLFGVRVSSRFVLGGALGLAGVALIFWPEFGRAAGHGGAALGALFTLASVLLSTVGSLTASRNPVNRLPLWPALGYGMLYGAAVAALFALAQGRSFAPPAVLSWWLSLMYLALAGSVLTFACFLTLQERIGPGPTGTVGVMTPLLALVVSMAFEGFHPDALTFAGAALAVLGNAFMLLPRRDRPRVLSTA